MRLRTPILLVASALIAVAATAPRDWSTVATRTPAGAILTGNPQARVKLVEYGSYTCSHCAHFAGESAPVLRGKLIRSGSTSFEYRHLIRDRLDLTAAVVARCTGPARFGATSEAIFADQAQWLPRGAEYDAANAQRLAMQPASARMRALADGSGLTAIGKAQGLSDARLDACFADRAEIDRIIAMTSGAPAEVTGTPTFFVNGKAIGTASWATLEPQLRAQGAK